MNLKRDKMSGQITAVEPDEASAAAKSIQVDTTDAKLWQPRSKSDERRNSREATEATRRRVLSHLPSPESLEPRRHRSLDASALRSDAEYVKLWRIRSARATERDSQRAVDLARRKSLSHIPLPESLDPRSGQALDGQLAELVSPQGSLVSPSAHVLRTRKILPLESPLSEIEAWYTIDRRLDPVRPHLDRMKAATKEFVADDDQRARILEVRLVAIGRYITTQVNIGMDITDASEMWDAVAARYWPQKALDLQYLSGPDLRDRYKEAAGKRENRPRAAASPVVIPETPVRGAQTLRGRKFVACSTRTSLLSETFNGSGEDLKKMAKNGKTAK